MCGATLCSWTHRRGEQFQNRNLTRFRIAFYFSQTRCRVCMWRSGTALWGESLLSVNRLGPGNPNQVIRLGGKAFPLLGSLTDPQLKKMWVYSEVQVLRECQGEVMAVRAVRLRQKSKFLTEKASFHFLSITDRMAVSPSLERLLGSSCRSPSSDGGMPSNMWQWRRKDNLERMRWPIGGPAVNS